MGAAGSVVVHDGGVNQSCTAGDTFALMEMKGVKSADARIDGSTLVGRNGHMVGMAGPERQGSCIA